MQTILLAGGTGKIGSLLSNMLVKKGYQVIVLTQKMPQIAEQANITYALWNTKKHWIDPKAIERSDCIINLAGAGIADARWTKKRKEILANSRLDSCAAIVAALTTVPHKVQHVIQGAAIGYYGFNNDKRTNPFKEGDASGNDFLSHLCVKWEQAMAPVKDMGIPLTTIRTGVVFLKSGGAYVELKKPLQYGIAAILGSGNQLMSWIHQDDICELILHTMEQKLEGVFNAVSPNSVSNKELVTAIARKNRKNYLTIKVPAFVLKAALGELSQSLLNSTLVDAQKILNSGFKFKYPTVDKALDNLR